MMVALFDEILQQAIEGRDDLPMTDEADLLTKVKGESGKAGHLGLERWSAK